MIEITSDAMERANTLLAGIPKGAEKVFSLSLNRGLSRVKTQALKKVMAVYTVNSTALNAATKINVNRASTGNLAGYVSFSGVKIPLYQFKVTPVKPTHGEQVRAAVKKAAAAHHLKTHLWRK